MRRFILLVLALALAGSLGLAAPAQAGAVYTAIDFDGEGLECLALTIYWEARGRGLKEQDAVAHVVLNRVADPVFPDTICGVVRQGGKRRNRCQFSWYCNGRPDDPTEKPAWREAKSRARAVLAGKAGDPTDGATYFHHVRVRPHWRTAFEQTAQLGPHIFYR
ncbi:MAG: cell wall hydrolase [Alphaproteobacteria bacterium]